MAITGRKTKLRLYDLLSDLATFGYPSYPTKNVKAAARKAIDTLWPYGSFWRSVIRFSFRVFRPLSWVVWFENRTKQILMYIVALYHFIFDCYRGVLDNMEKSRKRRNTPYNDELQKSPSFHKDSVKPEMQPLFAKGSTLPKISEEVEEGLDICFDDDKNPIQISLESSSVESDNEFLNNPAPNIDDVIEGVKDSVDALSGEEDSISTSDISEEETETLDTVRLKESNSEDSITSEC